ncbi:MAG: hypothetical protein DMF68_08235 [Acidobacteria bacterium]|nr:MAG: hypothetical protein DMF68_08235 [Acidobacteriota bacterium]
MRKAESWVWFVGLLDVGLLISFVFYTFGGRANPVMVILYFIFFMVHGYRDIIFFYQPSTDDRELERTRSRVLWFIQASLLIVLMNILVPAYLFYRSLRPKNYTPELKSQIDSPMPYLYVILVLSWLLLPACLIGLWRSVQSFPKGLEDSRGTISLSYACCSIAYFDYSCIAASRRVDI